jgi:hypothetical protein
VRPYSKEAAPAASPLSQDRASAVTRAILQICDNSTDVSGDVATLLRDEFDEIRVERLQQQHDEYYAASNWDDE